MYVHHTRRINQMYVKEIKKSKRFEMRMTPEDHEKLEKLWKHYKDKSAADFLMKFIRNEYHYTFEQEEEIKETLLI